MLQVAVQAAISQFTTQFGAINAMRKLMIAEVKVWLKALPPGSPCPSTKSQYDPVNYYLEQLTEKLAKFHEKASKAYHEALKAARQNSKPAGGQGNQQQSSAPSFSGGRGGGRGGGRMEGGPGRGGGRGRGGRGPAGGNAAPDLMPGAA